MRSSNVLFFNDGSGKPQMAVTLDRETGQSIQNHIEMSSVMDGHPWFGASDFGHEDRDEDWLNSKGYFWDDVRKGWKKLNNTQDSADALAFTQQAEAASVRWFAKHRAELEVQHGLAPGTLDPPPPKAKNR